MPLTFRRLWAALRAALVAFRAVWGNEPPPPLESAEAYRVERKDGRGFWRTIHEGAESGKAARAFEKAAKNDATAHLRFLDHGRVRDWRPR